MLNENFAREAQMNFETSSEFLAEIQTQNTSNLF